MAIVDKFRRAFRSASSSSSNSAGTLQPTQPTTTNDSSSTAASSSRLSKTISWRPKSKKTAKPHPAERPLSESHLAHQELLSSFSMTFGRRRSGRLSFGGVSPCTSRHASVDAGVPGMAGGLPRRREGSIAVVDEDAVMD